MIWRTVTAQRKARDRARIKVERINTKLIHCTGASHMLRGMGGIKTLTDICNAWNASGYDQPDPTRCAADYLSPKTRANFLTKISR
jgi:hypothetical protein